MQGYYKRQALKNLTDQIFPSFAADISVNTKPQTVGWLSDFPLKS